MDTQDFRSAHGGGNDSSRRASLQMELRVPERQMLATFRDAFLRWLSDRSGPFARAVGASTPRILFKHLLPNSLASILVQASLDLGGVILIAAGLSFIGFGAQPPTPEWGVMISDGRKYVSTHPWLPLFPGLAILFVVMAFNLIGDGLRDALDPRLRGN